MKVKQCQLCNLPNILMFRILVKKGKSWIFVCKTCCQNSQKLKEYKYGGTWKGG